MSLLSELEELQRCLEGNADSDTEEPSKHAESESSIGNETIHPVSITEEEFAEVENESNTVPCVSECEYTSLAQFIINEVDVSSKQEESKASREEISATVQEVPADSQVLLTDAKCCNSVVKIQDVKSLAPSHGARAENATTRPELPVLKVGKLLADSDSLVVVTSKCDVSENVPIYEKEDDVNSGLERDLSNVVEDVLPASLQQNRGIEPMSEHLKLEGVNSSAFRSKGMVKRSQKRSHSDTDTQKEREVTSEGEYMSDGIVTYINTKLQEESPPKKRKYTDHNMPGLRKRKAIFNVIMVKDNTSDEVLDEGPQMPNDIRPFIRKRKLPVHPMSSDTDSSLLITEDKFTKSGFIPVGKPGPKRWKRKELAGSYDSLVAESAGASVTSATEEVEMLSTEKNGKYTGLVSDACKKELMEARVVVKKLNIPIPEYLQSASSTRPVMLQETLAEVSKHIQESLTRKPVGRPRKVQSAAAEKPVAKQKITGRPKQRVVVKRMQKQKIVAKPIQKHKLVGKAIQKRKIVGKAIQKQKIIGKSIQKQKIVGKQVQKQKIVGKQIQKQKVVGRPTQKQKIAGKPTQKQKIAGKPIQNQKVVGKSIQKQKIVGKSMQNQKTVGRPIQKQKIMGKAMQKQQNAGKLVQSKKVEEGKTKPEIIRKLTAMQEIVGKLKQKQKIAKKSIRSLEEEMLGGTSAHQQGTSGLAEAILQRSMMRRALLPSITSRIGPKRKRTLSKKLQAFTINDLPGRKMPTVTQTTKQVFSRTGLNNSKIVQKQNKAASSYNKKTVSSPVAVKLNTKPSSVQKEKQSTSLEDKRKRQIEDSVSKKGKKVVPPTAKRSIAPHPEEVPSYASGEEDEWIVEVLLDDDVNMMISDPEATVDFSRVSSSDERPQGVLANASDAHRVLECDSSTDTDKQKVAGRNLKNSVSARVSDPSSIPAKKKKTESVALPHSKNVSSSVSEDRATTSTRRILPTEQKMLEMKKAISNLERVADRSMLRLKTEERQVIYLTNKLNEYENNKYHRNLNMILKDAEPGPRQSEHALFLLDLVLSYCPMEGETYSESLATQTVGDIL